METPFDASEGKETLAQLERRLRRDVADIGEVLRADVPLHVQRCVRTTFERSPRADDLDQAAVAALKAATQAASDAVRDDVLQALEGFEAWTWPSSEDKVPEDASSLRDHPGVAAVLDRVEVAVRALLSEHGFTDEDLGERGVYRMPSYFVAGHFMKSLVANYWRALADYTELKATLQDAEEAGTREERRARWDSA